MKNKDFTNKRSEDDSDSDLTEIQKIEMRSSSEEVAATSFSQNKVPSHKKSSPMTKQTPNVASLEGERGTLDNQSKHRLNVPLPSLISGGAKNKNQKSRNSLNSDVDELYRTPNLQTSPSRPLANEKRKIRSRSPFSFLLPGGAKDKIQESKNAVGSDQDELDPTRIHLQTIPLSPDLGNAFKEDKSKTSFCHLSSINTNSDDDKDSDMLNAESPASSTDDSIHRCDTPITHNRDENKYAMLEDYIENNFTNSKQNADEESSVDQNTRQTEPPTSESIFSFFKSHEWISIVYLSSFAIIGSTVRVFLARIFGADCESPPQQRDYLSPFSTCVTASGQTDQAGGALFIDLPANMVGSFILGILTPLDKDVPSFPWLKSEHPIQRNISLQAAIRTGLCGSITTLSSWNTQMIMMMVGVNTMLGSQVVPAFMGYMLGLILAISSFLGGRQFANAIYTWRNASNDIGDDSSYCRAKFILPHSFAPEKNIDDKEKNFSCCGRIFKCIDLTFHGKYSSVVFTTLIFILFLVGDYAVGNKFHKSLWITSIMAPLGTILRWQLSFYNNKFFQRSKSWKYIPAGTLLCNILACMTSALCAGIDSKLKEDKDEVAKLILYAIKVGFAGNLSTVSTFVKEIVHLADLEKLKLAYFYAIGTISICCISSLCWYGPIVLA